MAIEKDHLNTMQKKISKEGTESNRNTPTSSPDTILDTEIVGEEAVLSQDSPLTLFRSSQATCLSSTVSSMRLSACPTNSFSAFKQPNHQLPQFKTSSDTNEYICNNDSINDVANPNASSTSAATKEMSSNSKSENLSKKKSSLNSNNCGENGSSLINSHQTLLPNNAVPQKRLHGEIGYSTFNETAMNEKINGDHNSLGPLPSKWECAYTERGELYFIDHNTGTSHWLDPRLSKFQKKTLEDCSDNELPYGWEKIDDALYGTYYIDHVNRRTQYENPVLEAKRRAADQKEKRRQLNSLDGQVQFVDNMPPLTLPYKFTKNPTEMLGERITTTLLKSSRGLGITIIGGDDNVEEFLQIKSIVPNGPAWLDGRLKTGDILVYVNDTCVLGFTHHEMVNVFQSILPGETVTFEVCRGYPLPFDPNDPNTEVVTTIAVDGVNLNSDKEQILLNLNMDRNFNVAHPKNSADGLSENNAHLNEVNNSFIENGNTKVEILTLSIAKGCMGFGFTIADSAHGQKVKKILDRKSCKNLQEGDILLEINDVSVHQMSHCEVVRTLKECPKSESTIVKIQRVSNYLSPNTEKKIDQWKRHRDHTNEGYFRSKTPTAELYSTQQKEILPARPKTPVIDTRKIYVKNASNETRKETDIDFKNTDQQNEDQKSIIGKAKSINSLQDIESINNDINFMDPYQEIETNLSDRLTITSLNENCNSSNMDLNPYIFSDYGYNTIYDGGFTQQDNEDGILIQSNVESGNNFCLPLTSGGGTSTTTQHQDSCYCYDCQDSQRPKYYHHSQPALEVNVNQNSYFDKNQRKMCESKLLCSPLESHVAQHHQSSFAHPQMFNCSLPGNNNIQHAHNNNYKLFEVTLERQSQGFGFRIVGGTEEGSQVTIGHVVPGGAADGNSGIATGDEILSIDGVSVINSSHHKVVSLMGESAQRGQVTMILRRRLKPMTCSTANHAIRYPYDVVLNKTESEGFGFVIISSSNQLYGSTIGKLIPGSPADRCGEIKVGDHIVAVNRIDIGGMTHGNVVNLIKESGLQVRLTIGLPKEDILALSMQNASQFLSETPSQYPPL